METHQMLKTLDAKIGRKKKKPDGVSSLWAKINLTYCCSLCGIKENTGEEVLT